jgi:hypothetical protein
VDVFKPNAALGDLLPNEVMLNIDVLGTGMELWILGKCDGALIITVNDRSTKAFVGWVKLFKETLKPHCFLCRICLTNILSFTGRQGHCRLTL